MPGDAGMVLTDALVAFFAAVFTSPKRDGLVGGSVHARSEFAKRVAKTSGNSFM